MSIRQQTLYLTLAEYLAAINAKEPAAGYTASVRETLFDTIEEASREIEILTGRSFDERIETRSYTPRSVEDGGDIDGRLLLLDDTLLSASAVFDGVADAALVVDDYTLYPLNSTYYSAVSLNSTQTRWAYHYGSPAVYHSVTGVWGYPGARWVQRATITAALDAVETDIAVSSVADFEERMTLKIGSEYVRVEEVGTLEITVERGVNGSTAAIHLDDSPVYAYKIAPEIRRTMKRFAQWWSVQQQAPGGTLVTNGDTTIVVNNGRMPADLDSRIKKLRKPSKIRAINTW